jgi:hypothetical protein
MVGVTNCSAFYGCAPACIRRLQAAAPTHAQRSGGSKPPLQPTRSGTAAPSRRSNPRAAELQPTRSGTAAPSCRSNLWMCACLHSAAPSRRSNPRAAERRLQAAVAAKDAWRCARIYVTPAHGCPIAPGRVSYLHTDFSVFSSAFFVLGSFVLGSDEGDYYACTHLA